MSLNTIKNPLDLHIGAFAVGFAQEVKIYL